MSGRVIAHPRFCDAISVSIHQYPMRQSASRHVNAVQAYLMFRCKGGTGTYQDSAQEQLLSLLTYKYKADHLRKHEI